MGHIYDQLDLTFSWNGDYSLVDGDLEDTSADFIISLRQDLHTITASALADWEIYPGLGAGLDEFIGEPNLRRTADTIHDRIKIAVVSSGVVAEEDLTIKIIPVHIHRLLIILKVSAIPTPWNSLSNGEEVVVQLVFDFMEHGITFLETTPELTI